MQPPFKSHEANPLLDPYTHGLEKTYAIQHIDLNTVRLLQSRTLEEKFPCADSEEDAHVMRQFSLPFGEYYEEAIHSFWMEEPIEILGLSHYLETSLKKHERSRLRDVFAATQEELMYLKGIGQGHLEELFSKLNAYIGSKPKDQTLDIDPIAWFRSLFADLPKTPLSELLNAHGLCEKIPLVENSLEIFLSRNRSEESLEEAYALCREQPRRAKFMRQMRQIIQAFLMPWMRRRGGIASESELLERLENVSKQEHLIKPLLELFRKVFFPKQPMFAPQLLPLTGNLYADCESTQARFYSTLKQVHSYFYQGASVYEVEWLLRQLKRESARRWEAFDEQLFRRLILLDPEFYLEQTSFLPQHAGVTYPATFLLRIRRVAAPS